MIRVGIDVGGTFTDFALVAEGISVTHKQLTTPDEPERAVLEGLNVLANKVGMGLSEVDSIVHGTTLVTNALLERRGARVGMLVTEGFLDVPDIGNEQRYDLYDLRLEFAQPLVPRSCRYEIPERIRHDGSIERPLDTAAVERAVAALLDRWDIESVAVCYLHAYSNPLHEESTRSLIREAFPHLHISCSSAVFPYAREFERWTTACANAYAQPTVDRYIGKLESGLSAAGFRGRLAIMSSGAGLLTAETARAFPVRLLESGPAAGTLMAARIGRELELDRVLAFDLGGTTAKGALIRKGVPFRKYAFEAAHAYRHKSGSGLPLMIPVIDMVEIGSGGGSVVELDEVGRIRVGPHSAGAAPGPVCYGLGGNQVTLTDANLTLGYLDPEFFLGGAMSLEAPAAAESIERDVGGPLALDRIRAAWGIHDIANEDIARAFRMHATERGFDYQKAAMVAFGGGGPIHAARIARKLRVPRVLYPAGAGVMSAVGMLVGGEAFEVVRSFRHRLDELQPETLDRLLGEVTEEALKHVASDGLARLERRLDMRYCGQGYDIEVSLPAHLESGALLEDLPDLFSQAYRARFSARIDAPIEIVSCKIAALGIEPEFVHVGAVRQVDESGPTVKGERTAYFPEAGGMVRCPVHDRYRLSEGDQITGPALIEERESTVLIDVGDVARVDRYGNLVADLAQQSAVTVRHAS